MVELAMEIGNPVSFDQFCVSVKQAAEIIGNALVPEGQWHPLFQMITPRGFIAEPIKPHLLSSETGKDELIDHILPPLIRDNNAVLCALIAEISLAPQDILPKTSSRRSGSETQLSMFVFSARQNVLLLADIERTPAEPPELRNWRSLRGAAGRYARLQRYLTVSRSRN